MRPDPKKDTPMSVRGMKGTWALIAIVFAGMVVVGALTGNVPDLGTP